MQLTRDGGKPEIGVIRRRHRRRCAVKYQTKRCTYHCATSVVRPTNTLPLTPPTPRQQVVRRHLDTPETEKRAQKAEVEIQRTPSSQTNSYELNRNTTNSYDVTSARDVTFMAATPPTDDVIIHQTGSRPSYVASEGLHEESPVDLPIVISIPRSATASEIVRDVDDEERSNLEHESSAASLAQRFLCVLDCCNCCRIEISSRRRPSPPE